ncbi:hypothetical protein BS78_02G073200 [Paspalum vaginatum]|nr:hypothetical protein BS78_02G073200 [Paspalum vaginatum]
MERGPGVPMDAGQDLWDDWEVLPDHRIFAMGRGSKRLDDQESKEPILPPSSGAPAAAVLEPVAECRDIGVVPEETKPVPNVADLMVPEGHDDEGEDDEEEKVFQSPDAKEADDEGGFAEEEEDIKKDDKARPECVVFSVGKLKVNGIGALCSFGVAAATICVFLIGGRLQHHHRQQQQQKIQLQFYGDDKRIQQVVQQTSRLNQAMSSVMGAGASPRANISFGGFYDGF